MAPPRVGHAAASSGIADAAWTWPQRIAAKRSVRRKLSDVWRPEGGNRINLACGGDVRPGWLNVDFYSPAAEVRWDLLETPWPFESDWANWILADAFLEHVPQMIGGEDALVRTLREVQRVLRPGGRMLAIVPYFGSPDDGNDIFHYRHFTQESFSFLDPQRPSTIATQARLDLLRLARRAVLRRSRVLGVDTAYHATKYLRWDPNVGRKDGLVFVLEKVAPA